MKIYIYNLKNFEENKLFGVFGMFEKVSENVVIWLNKSGKILNELKSNCYIIDCSDDWRLKQKKIIIDTKEYIESCENSSQYKYECNGKCYKNCKNGILYETKW